MRVAESGRILKAKPKQAIRANMGGPNQSERQQPELLQKDRKRDQKQGRHEHMEKVVNTGAKPHAKQIAQNRKIRRQNQEYEQDPVGTYFPINKNADDKYDTALSAEKHVGTREHAPNIPRLTTLARKSHKPKR